MREIAKLLKTLGPNYELKFRMDYFGPYKGLVLELVYSNTLLKMYLKHQHQIPFEEIENFDEHGPQIINDMARQIHAKNQKEWGEFK